VFYNWDFTGDNFTPSPLNDRGQLAGSSNLASDPNLAGSYLWSFGKLYQLPTLPNGNMDEGGSNANGVNDRGVVVGASAYGQLSSYNGRPFYHAVVWTQGKATDLGDLGGHDSWANFINGRGVIAGYAYNTISDPYSYYGTQFRATIWQNGRIRDLGTLGGNDAEAWTANDNGQVIGESFVGTEPVPPFNIPQTDPFLWSNGTMTDLGNLGGGYSVPSAINYWGQVTVISFDQSNQFYQSYVWSSGTKYLLPSLAGHFVEASTLNDWELTTGASSDATDANFLGTVWLPWLHLTIPLGTVGGDSGSVGLGVNNWGVIVGGSGAVSVSQGVAYHHAFIWQNGQIQDLNTLIPANSPLTLNVAYAISDNGIIAGLGTNAQGDMHAFVLVPDWKEQGQPFATAAQRPAAPGSAVRVQPGRRLSRRLARELIPPWPDRN
jgi:probable HAF family extracellular repeat protein